MTVLTSELRLKLIDELSKPAGAASKALRAVGVSAADLKKLEKIDVFHKLARDVDLASVKLKQARQTVAGLKKEIAATESPSKKMQGALKAATRDADRAKRTFLEQGQALRQLRSEMNSAGMPVSSLASEEARLAGASQRATEMLERQARAAHSLGARMRAGLRNFGGNVLPFAGPALLRATSGALKAGAGFQHELGFAFPAAGIGRQEIGWARSHALALSARYPIVSPTDILQLYRESRSVISGEVAGRKGLTNKQRLAIAAADTQRIFPSIVQAEAALKAGGNDAGDLQRLIKGFEALGITQDPKRTRKLLNAYVKATQVAGKTIPVDTVLHAIQQMLGIGGQLSDRFIKSTFLSLVQEGGTRVGAGLGMMDLEFLGTMQHKQAEEWRKLGFLKNSDLIRTRTGAIKGLKPGHRIQGWQLAISSPDKFIWEVVRPALERAGYTTPQDQIAEIQNLFGRQRARRIAAALLQQQPTYEQAAAKFDAAKGLAAAGMASASPVAALNELTTSLKAFGTVLTSPLMADAAAAMDKMAAGIGATARQWDAFDKKHPRIAELIGGGAVGAAGYFGGKWTLGLLGKLFGGGFGLKGSAAALDTAAVNLNAAALALKGGAAAEAAGGGNGGGLLPATLLSGRMLGTLALPLMLSGDTAARAAPKGLKAWQIPKGWDYTFGGKGGFTIEPGSTSADHFTPWTVPPGWRNLWGVLGPGDRSQVGHTPLGEAGGLVRAMGAHEADARDAGADLGRAFVDGFSPEMVRAKQIATEAANYIIRALTFEARPHIEPTTPPAGAGAAATPSGDSSRGLFADYGVAAP